MTIQSIDSYTAARTDARPAAAVKQAALAASGAVTGSTATGQSSAAEPPLEQVKSAITDINKALQESSQNVEFSLDQDSKRVVVKVIDTSTKEVLRQMPTAEALEIAKTLDKKQGMLVDQEA